MSLATFSKELKLFDIEKGYNLSASLLLQEEKETCGRITWSGDGNWFAVAPTSSRQSSLPIVRLKENQLIPFKHVCLNSKVRSASFFSSTNRFIALGSSNGEIFIWDIKDKKVSTKLESKASKSNVDFLSINTEDKYLASASLDDNLIFLHGLKTNKMIEAFELFDSERISGLCFCSTKKNYLAASSLESTICVWDVTKSDYVFKSLNCHTGACTDIAFSPVNYSVIGSVGLTKNLKMFDWREKKPILESGLGEPLTCMDFAVGGDKVVAGTVSGSIIVYDLRSSEIIHNFKAHNQSVLSIKSHPMKMPKIYDDVDINTPDVVEARDKTLDISVIDILSPIKIERKENSVNSSKQKSFQSTPKLQSFLQPSDSASDDSFLSKIISPVSTVKKSTSFSPATRPSPFNASHLSPIVRPTANESPFSCQLPQIKEESPTIIVDEKCQGDGINNGLNSIFINNFAKDILKELQSIKNEQKENFQKLSNEISAVKDNLNKKHEILETKLEELYGATLQFRVDNVCQRILTNKLNEEFVECYDSLLEELRSTTLRLNLIHKMLSDALIINQ